MSYDKIMSFLKKKTTVAVAVLLLAILIGSYGYATYQQQLTKRQSFEDSQRQFQRTMTYIQFLSPKTFGYPRFAGPENHMISKETFEALVRYEGSSLDPKPALAERWEVSPDGRVYTFYLRHGVTFYPSGDTFNAQVVKWNYDNAFSGLAYIPVFLFGSPDWVQYNRTEIVNDYTVKIYINKPLAWFMRMVAYPDVGAIMNPKFIMAHGGVPTSDTSIDPYIMTHQDVTGSYIVDTFVPGDRIILKRNPTWWGWNSTFTNRPEQVVIRIVPETATRMMLIARGDGDIAYVDIQYLSELKKRISTEKLPLSIDESPILNNIQPVFDFKNPPTNDVHIRRALSWSFNYDEYIKSIMFGFGDRLISFVPKGMWGYQPDVPYYTFNLDKAKQELALATPENQAMVQKGIVVAYNPGYALGKEGYLMWKSDLAKIGVNLILNEQSYSTYRDTTRSGGIPIVDRSWTPDFPDPGTFYQFLGSTYYVAKAFGATSTSVNELMTKAAFETNADQRLKYYRQIEEWAFDQAPYLKVASKVGGGRYNVRGTWVKGYMPHVMSDEKALFYEIWKDLPVASANLASLVTSVSVNICVTRLPQLER